MPFFKSKNKTCCAERHKVLSQISRIHGQHPESKVETLEDPGLEKVIKESEQFKSELKLVSAF